MKNPLYEMLEAILKGCDRNAMPAPYMAIVDQAGKQFIKAADEQTPVGFVVYENGKRLCFQFYDESFTRRGYREYKDVYFYPPANSNFILATGDKNPLKVGADERRYLIADDRPQIPIKLEWREIGEGEWVECTNNVEWFLYCQRSPQHDTRTTLLNEVGRPIDPHKWCNKCGYTGLSTVHADCNYDAVPYDPQVLAHVMGSTPVWDENVDFVEAETACNEYINELGDDWHYAPVDMVFIEGFKRAVLRYRKG